MKYWTWAEIRAKIEEDLDLEDEDFVRRDELLGYANEAIDEAEAEIHSLYEDYFLTFAEIPVESGDQYISIPDNMPDIYADKIREIIFTNGGGTEYTVNRIKDWKKFKLAAAFDTGNTTDLYQYFPINRTAGNPELLLEPQIRESGTLKVWYLRNANRMAADTDVCDIPEFINFIFAHLKTKVFGKEGNPGYEASEMKLEQERTRMNAVLASRVPDAENELEMDTSSYEDMN